MNEDEWRKNNWRCNHGWLRGEQCEICNAPQRPWVGLTDEDVMAIAFNFDASSLSLIAKAIEAKLKEKNT